MLSFKCCWITTVNFAREKELGHAFNNAQITVVNPSFADDITLAASDASGCQQSINTMQEIVTWKKTMSFKASKCKSWAGSFLEMVKKPNSQRAKVAHIHSMIRFLQ